MSDYDRLKKMMGDCDDAACYIGVNEHGESVMLQAGKNENGDYVKLITCQENGWLRTNVYYENGDSEELYDK